MFIEVQQQLLIKAFAEGVFMSTDIACDVRQLNMLKCLIRFCITSLKFCPLPNYDIGFENYVLILCIPFKALHVNPRDVVRSKWHISKIRKPKIQM